MGAEHGERVMLGPWASFLRLARPHVDWSTTGRILCLDPGETTGWAIFNHGNLEACGQWRTLDPAVLADELAAAIVVAGMHLIVYEEYRVRGNKFKEHVGSEVVTIQHIGAIKVIGAELGVPLAKQSAGMAKGFATDAKLQRWGLYQTGKRHANDAIRHGCHWLLFSAARQDPRSHLEDNNANDQREEGHSP